MQLGLVAAILACAGAVHADATLGKSGALQRGIDLDLLELGPIEVYAAGGSAKGIRLAIGGEYELDAHWAIRVPLVVAVAGSASGYAELDLVPGAVYRFRSSGTESWVPYLGGGPKLGAWGADRPLLGLPLIVPRVIRGFGDLFDDHHHTSDGGGGDPNFDVKGGAGVELWAGVEYHAASWLTVRFGLALGLVRVDRVLIEAFSQNLALRLSI